MSELGCSDSSLTDHGVGGNAVPLISDRKNEEFKLLAEEFKMLATVEPWKSPRISPKRNTNYSGSSSDYYKRDYRRTVEPSAVVVNEERRVTPKKSVLKRKHSLSTWREE